MLNYIVKPSHTLNGKIQVPGDKSISHRVLMLGAIAEGTTTAEGFLESADCIATRQALQDMGVKIENKAKKLLIHGVGLNGLQPAKNVLDLGNSGTSIRLMTGLLAGQSFSSTLTGDDSLKQRPMSRVVNPLREMGAEIEMTEKNFPPIHIHGGKKLKAIHYKLPIASAQVKSGLMLAALYSQGEMYLQEPVSSRDHTERLFSAMQYPIHIEKNHIKLKGGHPLKAANICVPADISSAAFFMVGAVISSKSDIILENVGINPTRFGVISILREMGANITLLNERVEGGEPVADIRVQSSPLKGIRIAKHYVPSAIDEFPILFIAAACAEGVTVLEGAEELRVKESDRIQTMVEGLRILGIKAEAKPDGVVIHGGKLQGGIIESYGDHRIAMSFAMAGLRAHDVIEIKDCENVSTSFPNFVALSQEAGLAIETTRA